MAQILEQLSVLNRPNAATRPSAPVDRENSFMGDARHVEKRGFGQSRPCLVPRVVIIGVHTFSFTHMYSYRLSYSSRCSSCERNIRPIGGGPFAIANPIPSFFYLTGKREDRNSRHFGWEKEEEEEDSHFSHSFPSLFIAGDQLEEAWHQFSWPFLPLVV
ncbi:hypothetical protein MLD38_028793 [Melastoma candidum]|uniref:Uncharacterized protein n=1 Tax=Melastoma candidum TaxID=119954 RepID=A0ACB9N1R7_9MYRT|nr:hypothetical protein MLD38_028793 [Melastoma candidum]